MQMTLADLLCETPSSAYERRRVVFDELIGGGDKPIVLYGCGGLGRLVLKRLRDLGRPPIALADRRITGLGGSIDGIPAFEPSEAAERFGNEAAFVVTVWNAQTDHQYRVTRGQLGDMGVKWVAPAIALFWKYPAAFLPYYCLDVPERILVDKARIRNLADELADDASQDVLIRQLRWRLWMDFDALPLPVRGPAYFQEDLLPQGGDELFVDCGAYDGDTLRAFRARMEGNTSRVIAIEPDPASFARLESYVNGLPNDIRTRVRIVQTAVGKIHETIRFTASGTASAHASDEGTVEVDCLPLDEVLSNEEPTFIKMDLEGAEEDALIGGEKSIRRAAPSMAVCVYHRPDHLWAIPLLLRKMLPKHELHLRPHGYEGWDLVCYAVARGR